MQSFDHAFLSELQQQLHFLTIDELKERIGQRMVGRTVIAPVVRAGAYVYRARRVDATLHPGKPMRVAQLSYPPAEVSRAGRLNRAGESVFYSSTSKAPLLFELGADAGEEFIFSIWRLKAVPLLSALGYTNSVFSELGSARGTPPWLSKRPSVNWSEYQDVLSEVFAERVGPSDNQKYMLTAAIAEVHRGKVQGATDKFAGVLYPSVAMWANGDNVALQPWFVDSCVTWTKAIHLRVDAREDQSYSITELDTARTMRDDGTLAWAGHAGVKLQSAGLYQLVFSTGVDEFGDYILGKDNVVGHWVGVEPSTGRKFSV